MHYLIKRWTTHYFTNSNISFNCRIIISGASGGVSRINKVQSKADQIRALVHLVVNETLFIISGQMGSSVCQGFGEVSLWIFFIVIIKGQKIAKAIFLPSILPKHEGQKMPNFTLVSKMGHIKKVNAHYCFNLGIFSLLNLFLDKSWRKYFTCYFKSTQGWYLKRVLEYACFRKLK